MYDDLKQSAKQINIINNNDEESILVGRITSDSDGKPNETCLYIEINNNYFSLDLSELNEYFLYPN